MTKNENNFGSYLKELRLAADLRIRDICRKVGYDPSNWSKIERGKLPPPNKQEVLLSWAEALKISENKYQQFVDKAMVAQGIIPDDIMNEEEIVKMLPAFFRTIRGEKPTKKEIDSFIDIIKRS